MACRPDGRNESLRRVLLLERRLRGLHYAPSFQELAEEFAVTTRTIRRDFELLESVGTRLPQWRTNERLVEARDASAAGASTYRSYSPLKSWAR